MISINKKLILILALAIFLRMLGISSRPIWYDEAFSILLSEQGPSAILSGTLTSDTDSSASEEHPPAYYFALWGWMQLLGDSLPVVRTLSIAFSLGIILLIYFIARHLFTEQAALSAAFLSAILPFQIHYGVEIRMYVLLAFWLTLATFAFLKRWWILFSIAAALAQYTHNLAAFYLIPLALTPIFQREWKTLRNLILAGLAAIVLYIPWLIQLPAQFSKVTSSFWIEKPGVERLLTLFLMYLPHLPIPNSMLMAGLLIATLIIVLAAFQTFRARNANGAWLAFLSFTPPLLLWLVSQVYPLYVERALLPSHAIFCIWLGWAFTQTKLPNLVQYFVACLIFAIAGMGIFQHLTYNGFPYGPFDELNKSLEERIQDGDIIVHSSKLTYLPAFYFDPSHPQVFIVDPPGSNVDTLAPATQEVLNLRGFESIEQAAEGSGQIWLVIFQNSIDEYVAVGQTTHPHVQYLYEYFKLQDEESWGDILLLRYSKP